MFPLQYFFGLRDFFPILFSPIFYSPFNFFDDLRQNGWKISQRPPWRANSVQLLGFLGVVEENTLMSFCYFWTLDIPPTWAGPGLFLVGKEIDRETKLSGFIVLCHVSHYWTKMHACMKCCKKYPLGISFELKKLCCSKSLENSCDNLQKLKDSINWEFSAKSLENS